MVTIRIMEGRYKSSSEKTKEAQLLLGDAILNYKTVQSFGYENLLVDKYEEFMKPGAEEIATGDLMIGFGFGCTQLVTFLMNAGLFYVASLVLENTDQNQQDIFTAIFCMLFGAQ